MSDDERMDDEDISGTCMYTCTMSHVHVHVHVYTVMTTKAASCMRYVYM